ncbi:hypothetical protein [Micromonospora thermarum]|uniref:Uncharacterized protein n=1 Tax=Micromonospora thermarum TaxID=2720024 RepID=A0ABX0ZB59_9ACTN|nr:hypothetical protein [Micromonospora thermarum]NJP33709.1 hypothetical protein [Micromonospora thermarum]
MGSRRGWAGYDQPTLASSEIEPATWEEHRVPGRPVPLTEEVSTAAALVRAHGCSPQCLISAGVPVKDCDCQCRGAYHGVLSDADIPSALRRREATSRA